MSARALLIWGGLDFDTAELDLELREALAAVAPEGGALAGLPLTARVPEALAAARADATLLRVRRAQAQGGDLEDETSEERAADRMAACLYELYRAQEALLGAHEELRAAQRLLGQA